MSVATIVHESDNGLTFERVQDVEPILDFAHQQRVLGETGSDEMKHAASLPFVIVETYCNTKGITFADFMRDQVHIKSLLNDPALALFRIWKGQV